MRKIEREQFDERILKFVERNIVVTVIQVSRMLGISNSSMHQKMNRLARKGLLRKVGTTYRRGQ